MVSPENTRPVPDAAIVSTTHAVLIRNPHPDLQHFIADAKNTKLPRPTSRVKESKFGEEPVITAFGYTNNTTNEIDPDQFSLSIKNETGHPNYTVTIESGSNVDLRTTNYVREQTLTYLGLTPQSEDEKTASRFEAGEQIVTAAELLGNLTGEDRDDMLLDALIHLDLSAVQGIVQSSRRRIENTRLKALDDAVRILMVGQMSQTVFIERAAWVVSHTLLSADGIVPKEIDTNTPLGTLAVYASQMEFAEGQPNGKRYASQFEAALNEQFLSLLSSNSPYLDVTDPLSSYRFRQSMAASGYYETTDLIAADTIYPNGTLILVATAAGLIDNPLVQTIIQTGLGDLTIEDCAKILLHASANELFHSNDKDRKNYEYYRRVTEPYLIEKFLKIGKLEAEITAINNNTDTIASLSKLIQTREEVIAEIAGVLTAFFGSRSVALKEAAKDAKQLPDHIDRTDALQLAILRTRIDKAIL